MSAVAGQMAYARFVVGRADRVCRLWITLLCSACAPSSSPRSPPADHEPPASTPVETAAEPVSIEERSQPVDLGLPAPSVEPEWSGATLVSFLRTHPELRALIRSDAGEHLDGVAVTLQRGAAPTVCVLAATAVEPRCVVLPADAPVTELGLTGYGESAGAVVRQPLGDRDALFVLRARDGALLGPFVVERGEAELSSMDERLDGAPEVAVEVTEPDGAVAELLRGLLRARRLEVAPLSTWRSGDAVGGVHVIERDAARVCLSTPDWRCSAAGDFEFSTLGDYGDLYEYALWEPRSRRAFMVHHAWSNTNGVHSEDTMSDRLDVFGDEPLRVLGSMPLGELVSLTRDVGRMEGGAWQPRRAVVSVSWSTSIALQERCLVLRTTTPKRRRVDGWLVRPPKKRARAPERLPAVASDELVKRGLIEIAGDEDALPSIYPDLSGVWTFEPKAGFSRHSTSLGHACPSL